MYYLQQAVTGVFSGSVYALAGIGLVLTYKATGVFNFAHFTIGLFVAHLFWQLNGVWGLTMWVAAPLALASGAVIGLLLERAVFRPLQRRRASTSEKLVATLGVLVLFLGLVNMVWGPEVKGNVLEPVPRLFPAETIVVGDITFDTNQLANLIVVLVVGVGLWALFRYTYLGTRLRAVVDRRELAELASIDANRVSRFAWALGCGLAGLTGVLLSGRNAVIEPLTIVFFGIETFSVAVLARLVSLPMAVVGGILILGVGQNLLEAVHPFGSDGFVPDMYNQLVVQLSSVLLFVVLVVYRRLDEVGESGPTARGIVHTAFGRARRDARSSTGAVTAMLAVAALLPLVLDRTDIRYGQQTLALAVIFVSIVAITGFSGHIALGQATFAGIGAFFTARADNGLGLPVLVAMLVGGGAALVAGLIAGYPALKRKGLFLGLTTLSLAMLLDRFVLNTSLFSGGAGGLVVRRPTLFGLDLSGTTAFFYFELVVLALVLLLARNLRSGRLGRILGAMRDSETATRSIGVDLRAYKLFIFAASSFMAGIGGSLLAQSRGAWDVQSFNPVFSLFWFTAVIVFGVSSIYGALAAAGFYVLFPVLLDIDIQSAVFFIGVGALFVGRLPGGLAAQLGRLPTLVANAGRRRLAEAAHAPPDGAAPAYVPSAFAQRVLPGTAVAGRERS